jgi:DNA mismatch repair protein MutL
VLGEREAGALVRGGRDAGDLALEAFVARPDQHRATGSGIHLFVNARPVRDRLLRHALLEVYRDLLPRGRFPTALLFLRVAAGGVDVNVHPAKWEVRFADPRAVHRLVAAVVGEALSRRAWLGAGAAAAPVERVAEAPPWSARGGDWLFAAPRAPVPLGEGEAPLPASRPFRFGELRVLGQLHGTYLLLEAKEGLLLVDQHAAHERVLYESLRAAWREAGVPRQALLVPETLELEPTAQAALVERSEDVSALGYEVEPFGAGAVVVRAVPALLAERDPLGGLRGLAEQLAEGELALPRAGSRWLDAADRLFASLACHAARRAGDALAPAEQRALADALDAIPWAPTCPHGRPVAVPIAAAEIARRFGR